MASSNSFDLKLKAMAEEKEMRIKQDLILKGIDIADKDCSDGRWIVFFNYGDISWRYMHNYYYVRAVCSE